MRCFFRKFPVFLRVGLLAGALFCTIFAALPVHGASTAARDYKAFIVLDPMEGRVLSEYQADAVLAPASMTKLMTFAVLHDKLASGALSLSTPVRITAADAGMGGTQVNLSAGEVFSVEELLYAMMIRSANDAAHALARVAGGTVPDFIALMNAKARALGMNSTTFRTPHGLPPPSRRRSQGDVTTARDFAKLCCYLLRKTDVVKYTSVQNRTFGLQTRSPETVVPMKNHNHLLGRVAGVDGLKTGFTNDAGFCLAATAQRGGQRVLVILMGSSVSKTRDQKVKELLENAFRRLSKGQLVSN